MNPRREAYLCEDEALRFMLEVFIEVLQIGILYNSRAFNLMI